VHRFEGEVAIVTGGAMGIGKAVVERLAREGASVLLADIDEAAGEATADTLRARGFDILFHRTDVADAEMVDAMVAACVSRFGPPGVLINNAGVVITGDPLTLPASAWRRSLAVDLEALWYTSRRVIPFMLARGRGAIVNIASVHAFKIIAGQFPYPVAKHAVIGLTRALAIEYAAKGIRVNAVSPGAIDTPLNAGRWEATGDAAGERRRAEEAHPMKRIGTAEEVAAAVAFLASSEAGFITGENLLVDGGRSVVYMD
jgi:NAD(P)-dependent dehydrogenase (short-subunit alcohol dehydrogenase family)